MINKAEDSGPSGTRRVATGWPVWLRIALIGRRPRFTLVRVVVIAVMAFFLYGFILPPVRVNGLSMSPTYRRGSVNLVNRLAYLRHEPRRGEVVAVRISGTEYSASELRRDLTHLQVDFGRLFRPSLMYMKRIVGLPGETIAFSGGQLLVDGQPLGEPYCKFSCEWERPPRKLGPGEYFVVGDNRSMPMEEHILGIAKRAQIVGKVIL